MREFSYKINDNYYLLRVDPLYINIKIEEDIHKDVMLYATISVIMNGEIVYNKSFFSKEETDAVVENPLAFLTMINL